MQSNNHPQTMCPRHEIAFPINDTVQELDLKEESKYVVYNINVYFLFSVDHL